MMLSKQHVSNLLDNYQDCLPQGMKKFADRPQKEKDRASMKLRKYKGKFEDYITKHGTDKCPYQPRVHGDEITLLTEIVNENSLRPLFCEEEEEEEPKGLTLHL